MQPYIFIMKACPRCPITRTNLCFLKIYKIVTQWHISLIYPFQTTLLQTAEIYFNMKPKELGLGMLKYLNPKKEKKRKKKNSKQVASTAKCCAYQFPCWRNQTQYTSLRINIWPGNDKTILSILPQPIAVTFHNHPQNTTRQYPNISLPGAAAISIFPLTADTTHLGQSRARRVFRRPTGCQGTLCALVLGYKSN